MNRFLNLFNTRRNEEEWMDLPATSTEEFTQALYDIQWVNRNLGGTDVLLNTLLSLIPADYQGILNILDLGTGSADIPRALVNWARQQGSEHPIHFQIKACDLHPVAVSVSRQLCANYPEITVIQADALNLSYENNHFDFVISSMFMHHLENQQAVHLLQEMARLGRIGFIVNDLERHPLAWLGIKTLGHLTRKGRIFKNDAPLSVLRGFTEPELHRLKADSQLSQLVIEHQAPYRWILHYTKQSSPQCHAF